MTILPSRQASIQALVARLEAGKAGVREAAVARLRLHGREARAALLAFLPQATPEGRRGAIAVLEALEGDAEALRAVLALCADPDPSVAARALEAALERASDSPAAAAACAALLTTQGARPDASLEQRLSATLGLVRLLTAGAVEALEPLLGLLLDESVDERLRLAAAPVLDELQPKERGLLVARLATSASAAVRARVRSKWRAGEARAQPERGAAPAAGARARRDDLDDALAAVSRHGVAAVQSVAAALVAAGALSDADAARAVEALAALHAPALPALQQALEGLTRARGAASEAARAEAKAVLHLALARLDSRLALYDLREMLAARPPRALARLLAAATQVGDASVAAELARLVAHAPALHDACAATFAAIVAREGLSRRHRAWRALAPEAREALSRLWPRP